MVLVSLTVIELLQDDSTSGPLLQHVVLQMSEMITFVVLSTHMWCTRSDECCTTPYFLKTLPQPTTDDIEMRVCRSGDRDNEDIAIETVEIYVQ